jgi:hypothetical protein
VTLPLTLAMAGLHHPVVVCWMMGFCCEDSRRMIGRRVGHII